MARSYDVIQAEILKLQQEAEEALADEREAAIARIREEMAHFGITVDELRGPVPARRTGAPAKKGAAAPAKRDTQVATGRSYDESPAVRMLEQAGIDFRRKNQRDAPTPGQVTVAHSKPAKKVAPRKVAAKRSSKTKGAPTR